MTSQQVAHYFAARRAGEGRWSVKCPLHQGQSDGSLSISATDDGKTLVKCWGGCKTEDVLATVGLSWADLFPQSSKSYPCQLDPKVEIQRKAERDLKQWKDSASRMIGYRIWRRQRLIAQGERLIAQGLQERGWDLLAKGYVGLQRLTWLGDLLVSKQTTAWIEARHWGVHL